MATMKYCAFENTQDNMRICYDKLGEVNDLDELSYEELVAFKHLIVLCSEFVADAERFDEDEILDAIKKARSER